MAGGRFDIDSWQSENIIPRLMSRLRSVFRWGKGEGGRSFQRHEDSMKIAIKRTKGDGWITSFRSIICRGSWHFEPMFRYAIPSLPLSTGGDGDCNAFKGRGRDKRFRSYYLDLVICTVKLNTKVVFAVVTFTEGKVTRIPP